MPRLKLTRKMCYASGQDAANRSMRMAGRTKWNKKDYNAACKEFNRLSKIMEAKSDQI